MTSQSDLEPSRNGPSQPGRSQPGRSQPGRDLVANLADGTVVIDAPRRMADRAYLHSQLGTDRWSLLVAAQWPDGPYSPVALLLQDIAREAPAIDAAFALAEKLHSPLVVVHHWNPDSSPDGTPDGGPEARQFFLYEEIEKQKEIDAWLSDWHARHPAVGVSVELSFGLWSRAIWRSEHCPVLVLGMPPDPRDNVVESVLALRDLPVLLVPVPARVSSTSAESTVGSDAQSLWTSTSSIGRRRLVGV